MGNVSDGAEMSDVQVERAVMKVLDEYVHKQEMLFILGDFSTKLELLKCVRDDVEVAIQKVYRDSWQQREGEREGGGDKPEGADTASRDVGTSELW